MMTQLTIIDWTDVDHFEPKEFEDDQGNSWIDPGLVYLLDHAREETSVPFRITSACRNPKQNTLVGGSKTSAHLEGLAVDIDFNNYYELYEIVRALISVGFRRIIICYNKNKNKSFLHTDIDHDRPNPLLKIKS